MDSRPFSFSQSARTRLFPLSRLFHSSSTGSRPSPLHTACVLSSGSWLLHS